MPPLLSFFPFVLLHFLTVFIFAFVYLVHLINTIDVADPLINNIPSWRQIN